MKTRSAPNAFGTGFRWSLCIAILFVTACNNNSRADNTTTREDSPGNRTIYVSTTGRDTNPGTKTLPYATLQKAVDVAPAGSVIWVRGGVYHQHLVIHRSGGTSGHLLKIEGFPGEQAILDGSDTGSGNGGLIQVTGSDNICIQNLTIQNLQTNLADETPMGIQITGHDSNIQLLHNHIRNIGTRVKSADGNAHGIGVYGHESHPIDRLVITGNTIDHLQLGSSETIALNGNVTNFVIANNTIHDCNNIGIDLIGFEGTAPTPSLDRARHGVVRLNTVYNISSHENPAYGGQYSADGIYVDGGTDIQILSNQIYGNDYGIELASEHADGCTTDVVVKDNIVYENRAAGLSVGGYDEKRGYTANCTIEYNTFYHNDTLNQSNGQIAFAYDTRNLTVSRNIFDGGNQAALLANPFRQNAGNHVDQNVWFTSAGAASAAFQWKQQSYTGFHAYQQGTGNDQTSAFVQPQYVNPSAGNFHQQRNSPSAGFGAGDMVQTP